MIAPCHHLRRPRPPEPLAGKPERSLCRKGLRGHQFTIGSNHRPKRNQYPTEAGAAGAPIPRAESLQGYSPGWRESASGGLGKGHQIVLRPVGPAPRKCRPAYRPNRPGGNVMTVVPGLVLRAAPWAITSRAFSPGEAAWLARRPAAKRTERCPKLITRNLALASARPPSQIPR